MYSSRTSIIWLGNLGVSLKMRINYMHCCLSITYVSGVDQGVVYPFDYPAYSVIRPSCGTKVSRFYNVQKKKNTCENVILD